MSLNLQAMVAPGSSGHLVPAATVHPNAGLALSSGLCMRRRWRAQGRGRNCAVAAGGLLRLPLVSPKPKRKVLLVSAVASGGGSDSSGNGDAESSDEVASVESDAAANVDSAYKSRRDMLQEYVKNVQPEFMERFVQKAPAQVDHFCFVAFRAEAVTWRRVLRGSIAVSCLAVLIFVMFFL